MLVVLSNAVKVESVPLNSIKFFGQPARGGLGRVRGRRPEKLSGAFHDMALNA